MKAIGEIVDPAPLERLETQTVDEVHDMYISSALHTVNGGTEVSQTHRFHIEPGMEDYIRTNFESGNEYLVIWFHPDNEPGEPHFAKGMLQTSQLD